MYLQCCRGATSTVCRVLVLALAMPVTSAYAQAPILETPPPPAAPPAAALQAEPGGFSSFMRDVGRDYKNFISLENAEWAAVGGTVALVMYQQDRMLSPGEDPTPTALKAGAQYGNPSFQVPLAMTWWIAGHAAGSQRAAAAGRDLLRAQVSAFSWTYAIKYAVGRTRPNGDPRSFPSGHASATFATAMVLHEHYGWKLGLPMFAAATYTAVERIYDGKHWPSDVAFGAVVGMLSGRTVTVRLRSRQISIAPEPLPGGSAVRVHVFH